MRNLTDEQAADFAAAGYTPVWANQIEEGWEIALVGVDYREPERVDYVTAHSVVKSVSVQREESILGTGNVIPGSKRVQTRFFGEFADGRTFPYDFGEHYPV